MTNKYDGQGSVPRAVYDHIKQFNEEANNSFGIKKRYKSMQDMEEKQKSKSKSKKRSSTQRQSKKGSMFTLDSMKMQVRKLRKVATNKTLQLKLHHKGRPDIVQPATSLIK